MKHVRTFRTAGWLAVAALLGAALIGPTAMLAHNNNHDGQCGDWQTGPTLNFNAFGSDREDWDKEKDWHPDCETSTSTSSTSSGSTDETTTQTTTDETTTQTTTDETTTQTTTDETTTQTTTETTTETTQTTETTTEPQGSVEAETGTPNVTPPPTDTFASTSSASGDSWRLILLAMAGLLAAILVLTPATAPRKR